MDNPGVFTLCALQVPAVGSSLLSWSDDLEGMSAIASPAPDPAPQGQGKPQTGETQHLTASGVLKQ